MQIKSKNFNMQEKNDARLSVKKLRLRVRAPAASCQELSFPLIMANVEKVSIGRTPEMLTLECAELEALRRLWTPMLMDASLLLRLNRRSRQERLQDLLRRSPAYSVDSDVRHAHDS